LRGSSLEANVGDNLLGFVNGHIFNHQPHRAFALAHAGLRIVPELTKAFWSPIDFRTLFRADLMLIALVGALFDGACLFQLTQFRVPFRF